jgi:hypothetical protein
MYIIDSVNAGLTQRPYRPEAPLRKKIAPPQVECTGTFRHTKTFLLTYFIHSVLKDYLITQEDGFCYSRI